MWNPVAKHGSGKRQKPQILIRPAGTPPRRLLGSAISRGRKPAFHMLQYLSHDQRSYFTAQPQPCLVPGCRLVPSKIAASGARALLAMTESVGFSEKRDSIQNEIFEKRCGATPRKKTAYNKKRPFSKQNRPNFVSLRGRRAAVAIFKPKVWHSLAKHGTPARRISNISEIKMVGFIAKPTIFVSLRGRPAAVAILKSSTWNPVAKHGSGKRQNPEIFDPPRRFILPRGT